MGCNLSFLTKNAPKHIEKRVLILGLDNAGKSCLCYQIKEQQFKETSPTIGLNVESVIISKYNINFWDVGGQATMLWSHYYEDTNAILFAIDLSDEARMEQVHTEFKKLAEESVLQNCPIIIVGNKIDIEKHMKEADLAKLLEFEKHSKVRKMKMIYVSAKLGEGIKEIDAPSTSGSTENTNSLQAKA
jgi:small GTP-binding protein